MSHEPNFDRLNKILYEGDVVASDFKAMRGTDSSLTRDQLAKVLIESMERTGLVVDGKLVSAIKPKVEAN